MPRGGREPIAPWRLALATAPWLAVSFSWTVEFSTQLPYMAALNVAPALAGLTWAAGPISGLVVQPIVGTLSDACESPLGRRRPFLLLGGGVTVVLQFCYAWAMQLGEGMGDAGCERGAAVFLAVVSFILMDMSINVIQTPLRAIVADLAPAAQQELGQSMAQAWTALGAISAFGFTAIVGDPVASLHALLGTASLLVVLSVGVSAWAAQEVPLRWLRRLHPELAAQQPAHSDVPQNTSACGRVLEVLTATVRGIRALPPDMKGICIVQVATWLIWFAFNPIWSNYMGELYQGQEASLGCEVGHSGDIDSAAEQRFSHGVAVGSQGMVGSAVLQFVTAAAVPSLLRFLGHRRLYLVCFGLAAMCFFVLAVLPVVPLDGSGASGGIAAAMLAITGIPYAVTNIVPFALVGRMHGNDPKIASYMASLNIFIVLPQLFDTLFIGALAGAAGWRAVIVVACVWSVFAIASLRFLVIPEKVLQGHDRQGSELGGAEGAASLVAHAGGGSAAELPFSGAAVAEDDRSGLLGEDAI